MKIKARHRRAFHLSMVVLWVGPGLLMSVFLKNSVPWVVFMSWFANVYSCMAAWAAETPVEQEDLDSD